MEHADIEKLVQWTYRTELPKWEAVSGAPNAREWLGERVDGGRHDFDLPRYQEWMGAPHGDAMIIADAVQKVRPIVFEWSAALDLVLGPAASTIGLKRTAGGVVPTASILRDMTLDPRSLIITHGRLRSRPDISPSLKLAPRRHEANGKPVVWSVDPETGEQAFDLCPRTGRPLARAAYDKAARMRVGAACPVVYEPSLVMVARERLEYLVWWRGLYELAESLRGHMAEHHATAPAASPAPWRLLPTLALSLAA
jgi:hypothetical protein